jgi:biopolymer transport protein ExbD
MGASTGGGKKDDEFEVNIVPIIDCFTVLITFLLVSVSFVTLGVLPIQPMITFEQYPPPLNPPTVASVLLQVQADQLVGLRVEVKGKLNKELEIEVGSKFPSGFNDAQLKQSLEEIKQLVPDLKGIGVNAPNDASYDRFLSVVAVVRLVDPAVLMEGFDE